MSSSALIAKKVSSMEQKVTADHAAMKKKMALTREFLESKTSGQVLRLDSSNPIYSAHEKVLNAGSGAWFARKPTNPFTPVGADCKSGNTLRYYTSKTGDGIENLRKHVFRHYIKSGIAGDMVVGGSIIFDLFNDFFNKGIIKKGDVLISTLPIYGPFFNIVDKYGCLFSLIKRTSHTNYRLTPDMLKSHLQMYPSAAAFLFVNPDNPFGIFYTRTELAAFAKIFVEHNIKRTSQGSPPLLVLADEVGRNVLFKPELTFHSLAAMPGMQDFTYTMTSLSKDQAPGISVAIGWGAKWLIKKLWRDSGPGYSPQAAAAATFNPANQNEMRAHYKKSNATYYNNLIFIKELIQTTNILFAIKFKNHDNQCNYPQLCIPVEPEGGLQCVIQITGIRGLSFPERFIHPVNTAIKTVNCSLDFAWYLKEQEKVVLIPGEGCGFDGEEMIFRITLSKKPLQLIDAFEKITDCILALKQSRDYLKTVNSGNKLNLHSERELSPGILQSKNAKPQQPAPDAESAAQLKSSM